eukprot:m.87886 g.87886  ORF g.87886 m.87886 type:complete len:295 (-) comp21428_c0_seq2:149-1033(-)
MHPEDFASTMRKKMASSDCCSDDYKLKIRTYYYAMIREYDAMVGVLLDAVRDAGVADDTYIILLSDHGDMQMVHRQFYKMVFQDLSSRVPLIISGPGVRQDAAVQNLTSSLDIFPTLLDMAGVDLPPSLEIDGHSLMPFLKGTKPVTERPNWVISQFHGDDIHLSWYLLRQGDWKYVTYGTGKEVPSRLYNMTADPLEMNDLASSKPDIVAQMDALLRTILDYPSVSAQVESYNKDSFALWRASMSQEAYQKAMENSMRYSPSFDYNKTGSYAAIEQWLKTPNNTFFWAFDENH